MIDQLIGAMRRWLGSILLVLWLVGMVQVAAVPLSNTDTYFHLRFGHELLSGWMPWNPGTISSVGTREWVPTQWLSEVVMAAAERLGGLAAVVWLFGAVLIAFTLTLFFVFRHRVGAGLAASLAIITMLACLYGLSARPQLLSYLFMAVVAHAWLRTVDDDRPRWWLVPLTWLWAMCHGMWPLAIVFGLAVTFGLGLDGRPRRTLLRLAAIPAASFAAAGLTPVGPRLYDAVLVVAGRGEFFTEWATPDFSTPVPALGAALVAAAVVVSLRRAPQSWAHVICLVFAAGALVYSNRTVPIGVTVAAVLLTQVLGDARRTPASRRETWSLAGAGVAAVLLLAALVPARADHPLPMPAWVGDELSQVADGSRVLSDDITGGYLVWAHPELDVLYFGYGDIYTTAELEAKAALFGLEPGWDATMARLDPAVVVIDPELPLAYALERTLGWHVTHTDEDLVYLVPPAPA